MAKSVYIGVQNTAKHVGAIYIGVAGTVRKLVKGYVGVYGMAMEFFSSDPVLIFETSTPGTYSQPLAAGKYEITLIGGGGGAAGARSTAVNNHHYAQGGVGGTLQVIAKLNAAATVSIVVGAGGSTANGTFASAGTTVTGTAGGLSKITGFGDLTAQAGGGTGATIRSSSTSACSRTVGKIGTNTISGSCLVETLIDNPTAITSLQSTSTGTSRTATGRENTNWPEDPKRGQGGDSGWRSTSFLTMHGSSGFVRIRKL